MAHFTLSLSDHSPLNLPMQVLSQAVQQKAKGMVTEEHLSGAILMVFLDSAKNLPVSTGV